MWIPDRDALKELLSPLALAALVAWLTVWMVQDVALHGEPLVLLWCARAALLVFLAAFLATMLLDQRLPDAAYRGLCVVMALAALVPIGLAPTGTAPILLVLLAAVLAGRLALPVLVPVLLVINLAHLLLIVWLRDSGWVFALVMTASFASFQTFAVLVIRYASRAESMAAQLRLVNAELLATRSLLEQSAREGERLRVSRELHDVAGHALTALKLNLTVLARDPVLAPRPELATASALADELLADIRSVVRQLREHVGVEPGSAIAQLAAPLPRPRVHLDLQPGARAADVAGAEALVRCAQEALTNAARHSGAANVWVRLHEGPGVLQLEVRDDGRGDGGGRGGRGNQSPPGNGLEGMRERLAAAGGSLDIQRTTGHGWSVRARVPGGDGP